MAVPAPYFERELHHGEDIVASNVSLLLSSGAILLDVRTPQEFAQGHIDGSINVRIH